MTFPPRLPPTSRGFRDRATRRHIVILGAALAAVALVAACTSSVQGSGERDPAASSAGSGVGASTGAATDTGTMTTPQSVAPSAPTTTGSDDATDTTSADPTSGAPGTTDPSGDGAEDEAPPVAWQKLPAATPVWAKTPAGLAVAVSQVLFASSPVVIVADGTDKDALADAADLAKQVTAPVLLAGAADAKTAAAATDALATEVGRLGARWMVPVGAAAKDAAADVADRAAGGSGTGGGAGDGDDGSGAGSAAGTLRVADSLADLPELPGVAGTGAGEGQHSQDGSGNSGALADPQAVTALLTHPAPKPMTAGVAAAEASVQAAGAQVVAMSGGDPRADSAVIKALSKAKPDAVLAVGPHVGSAKRLAARVAVAETGVQLPGGGQTMFPGRTLVALYGHPGTGSLGVLGAQGLDAAIKRADKVAGEYKKVVKGPVVPAFEIIATVATAGAGSDGKYSSRSSIKRLGPWVEKATKAGMYVILDLQPGRAHLLDQAKEYTELLENPSVGLALDPEWKLGPHEKPLQQIGHVEASEVNSVIDWLGKLTVKHDLPQKLLVLHQFRLSMLRDESKITTDNDNVQVLIHMDGQGSPGAKESTWAAIVRAAPKGVVFGWKNFYEKDHPTYSPKKTMDRKPVPVMISYQ